MFQRFVSLSLFFYSLVHSWGGDLLVDLLLDENIKGKEGCLAISLGRDMWKKGFWLTKQNKRCTGAQNTTTGICTVSGFARTVDNSGGQCTGLKGDCDVAVKPVKGCV